MATPHIFEYEYYQRLHDLEERHWWAMGMRDIMVALFQNRLDTSKPLKVLDAGCGTGYLLNFLKRYRLDGEVIGIDSSPHALQFCQERGATQLALASVVTPPFASETFDLVICIDTVQHLSPRGADQSTLTEFARLLRPGGFLYLRTNSALGHAPLRGADPDQYRRYRRGELRTMVTQAGLKVDRVSYINAVPALWGMLKEYLTLNRAPAAAIGPGLTIKPPQQNPLTSALHGLLRGEAGLIKLGVDLPFGHSLVLLARKSRETTV